MQCASTEVVVRELVLAGMDIMIIADTYHFNGMKMTMWADRKKYAIMVSDENVSCITITGPLTN